jgi:diguanylate cyclase (GGDEF)-like protein
MHSRQQRGDDGAANVGLSAAELCFIGPARDFTAERVRQEQIDRIVRVLPFTSVVTVLNATLVGGSLYGLIPAWQLVLWLGTILVLNASRVISTRSQRKPVGAAAAKQIKVRSLLIGVAFASAMWTVPPLIWFHQVGPNEQLLIAVVVTGMMSGGSITLATAPAAAFLYVAILSVALFFTELQIGMPFLAMTALLYGVILCGSSLWFASQFVAQIRARSELGEKGEMIELLREFDASGSDWLWELDAQYRLTYLSREMVRHLGIRGTDLLGVPLSRVLDPTNRVRSISAGMRSLFEHLHGGVPFRDLVVPVGDGQRWWSLSGKPQLDTAGQCIGWRGVGSDVTEVRTSGSDGLGAARHDPMTGLANRLMIREQLEEALLRQEDGASACSLLLVDLDRFKLVNDTLGHSVGDQLLCEVALRLQDCAGEGACIGRLGGDEFAIVWFGDHEDVELAELSDLVISSLSQPFVLNGSELTIGATIGVARSPRDGQTQEELTRSADLALYRAKEAGRGSFQFFDAEMIEEARSKRQLESDLRAALQTGGLTLAFQPIVAADNGAVVGHEALLRWNHPERGDIAPDLFVPVIEDVGLISQVGSWVIREACAEAASWPEHIHVAVNVSAAQLAGSGLAATVVQALASSGLSPDRLELEITESLFLGNDAATLDSLERLRMLGVRLVLDDFGTGYSSFGYLARARFHKIKIDKSFVHAVSEGSRQASAIVEAITALAHGLGLVITAEGVETAEQATLMRLIGCDLLQGYYFGRPELSRPRLALEPAELRRKRA